MQQVQCDGQNVGKPCATHAEVLEVVKTEWRRRIRRGGGGVSAVTKWTVIAIEATSSSETDLAI